MGPEAKPRNQGNNPAKSLLEPVVTAPPGAAAGAASASSIVTAMSDLLPELLRLPNHLVLMSEDGPWSCDRPPAVASLGDAQVECRVEAEGLEVLVRGGAAPLRYLVLRWTGVVRATRFLGDHWERAYGDLEWRGLVPERVMPWYVVASDGRHTTACGVQTGAAALAAWQVDGHGVSLLLDLRAGGVGAVLTGRELAAARILTQTSDQRPFVVAQAFCRRLCPRPRLPDGPIYGGNNWYHAYGRSCQAEAVAEARRVAGWAPAGGPRPYMVMDDGWQVGTDHWGPWDRGNERFPDLPGLAGAMREAGCRPGLWIRPLTADPDDPPGLCLDPVRICPTSPWKPRVPLLDPWQPAVQERLAQRIRRLAGWGFELIKHDYTTYDLCGHWGMEMRLFPAADGWAPADRCRTTAEVLRQTYATIQAAAGSAVVLACNVVGHLAAGLAEVQRTGDDTSGRDWERTRRMGINALAFRMPQHGAFFAVDADCVGLTREIPWHLNRQWLDLLARSGTPLFVSADPAALDATIERHLAEAFAQAVRSRPPAEPLDWDATVCPTRWRLDGQEVLYDWYGPDGSCRLLVPQA